MLMKLGFRYFVVTLFCLLLLSCSETTNIDTNAGVCEILKQHPNWRKSLKQTQAKYKLEPAFVMALIYQESRFDANAKNKYSSAYGYAQVIDSTWKHFQQQIKSNAKRNNFDDSVKFIGWYMAQLSKILNIKMTDYSNLYMAYMLGATGFKRYKAGTLKNHVKIAQDKKIALKVKDYTNLYKSQLRKCPL